ncbi:MAG: hypothetical protein ACP5J4_17905 [Anaerolineae bacterium]
MRGSDGLLAKLLVAYYGFIEVLHIIALAQAGVRLARTGAIGFPAPPPPGGWVEQLYPFLVAMAVIDAINVAVAWVFVYGYFTQARWRWWAGSATLTAAVYSAIVFAWGTLVNGAWSQRPAGYLVMSAVFVPVAALAILYVVWAISGQLWVQGKTDRYEKM